MATPYYLQANVDNAPTANEIFNFSITTDLPHGIDWTAPTTSVWDDMTDSISNAGSSVKSSVSNAFVSVENTVKDSFTSVVSGTNTAFDAVTGKVLGLGDSILGTLAKYFIIVAGALILLAYVAGKTKLVQIRR